MSGATVMDNGADLLADLMFELPQVPYVLAARVLNHAIRRLSKACIFQPIINVPVQDCVAEVKFEDYVPEGYTVEQITQVKYCGCCLDPVGKCDPCPHGYRVDDLCQITLYPAPSGDSATDLELCLTVKPSRTSCDYPKETLDKYDEELMHAMKAKLMSMPNEEWKDTRLAAYHEKQFEACLADVAAEVDRQFNNNTQSLNDNTWLNMEVGR